MDEIAWRSLAIPRWHTQEEFEIAAGIGHTLVDEPPVNPTWPSKGPTRIRTDREEARAN